MGRIFRISSDKYTQLVTAYINYGCSEGNAERLASRVFDHVLEKDDSMNHVTSGWEIEESSSVAKKAIEVQKKRIYANWLKGGWNRAGAWEIKKTTAPINNNIVNSGLDWHSIEYISKDYVDYMNHTGRNINKELVDDIDFLENSDLIYEMEPKVDAGKKRHYVMAVDVTGSMRSRWVLVQLTMVALYNRLEEMDEVSVITFSDRIQMECHRLLGGNLEKFMEVLETIKASGGCMGIVPVFQTAYSLLTSKDKQNTVIVFTDGAFESEFGTYSILDEFIKEQTDSGRDLTVLAYGSETWNDKDLIEMVNCAAGRLRAVLEPDNIYDVITANVCDQGRHIRSLRIDVKDSIENNAGKWESICFRDFRLTSKIRLGIIGKVELEESGKRHIRLSWEEDGEHMEELIELNAGQ